MLDAISSVVSAVAAQSVDSKGRRRRQRILIPLQRSRMQRRISRMQRLQASARRQLYMRNQDSKDDSKDTAKSTVNQEDEQGRQRCTGTGT